MKKFLALCLLSIVTFANALNIGDSVPSFQINDQFDKKHTIAADAKTLIVAADKGTSEIIRDVLLAKDKNYLETNKAYYIADISGMPSLIAKFFALPKMKKYPFSILLVDEEQSKSFTKKEDNITIYTIENGQIAKKEFVQTKEELEAKLK